jgi:hypothetical protein
MNVGEYVQRVFQVISGGKPDAESPVLRSAIERDLANTLQELADEIYKDPARRRHLQKHYSAAYASGIIDLSASPFTDLLFDSILGDPKRQLPSADVYYPNGDGTSTKVEMYQQPSDVDLPKPAGLYQGSVRANGLIIRDENGAALANATVDVYANRIPQDLTEVPSDLDNDAVNTGINRMMSGRSVAAGGG